VLQPVFLVFRNLKIIPNDMAREELDIRASVLIKTPHAIISIIDPDSDLPTFAPNENRLGILFLQFYDLDDISDQMSLKDALEHITCFGRSLLEDDQAAQIVAFVKRMIQLGRRGRQETTPCQTGEQKNCLIRRLDIEKSAL
jgi:hypothetical protein